MKKQVGIKNEILYRYRREGGEIFSNNVMEYQTWVYHYGPEREKQPIWHDVWKLTTQPSAGKLMLTPLPDVKPRLFGIPAEEHNCKFQSLLGNSSEIEDPHTSNKIKRYRFPPLSLDN